MKNDLHNRNFSRRAQKALPWQRMIRWLWSIISLILFFP